MGIRYYSYAIIGLRIDPDKLFRVEEQPVCDCNNEKTHFCSECGKGWKDVDIPIDGVTVKENAYDEEVYSFKRGGKVYDVEVLRDYDNIPIAYFVVLVRGGRTGGNVSGCVLTQIPMNSEVKKMKADLADIWDADAFGMWSLSYVS